MYKYPKENDTYKIYRFWSHALHHIPFTHVTNIDLKKMTSPANAGGCIGEHGNYILFKQISTTT